MTDIDRAVATSTDPDFVRRQFESKDGRCRRSVESRRVIIAACRRAMELGIFRPTMRDVCAAAKRAHRTGFQLFGTIEAVHLDAIKDGAVCDAIATLTIGEFVASCLSPITRAEIVRAIVTGRVA